MVPWMLKHHTDVFHRFQLARVWTGSVHRVWTVISRTRSVTKACVTARHPSCTGIMRAVSTCAAPSCHEGL